MFNATVYVETSEGKIEKLSSSFKSSEERNIWLMDKLQHLNFSYLIVNGESIPVQST